MASISNPSEDKMIGIVESRRRRKKVKEEKEFVRSNPIRWMRYEGDYLITGIGDRVTQKIELNDPLR